MENDLLVDRADGVLTLTLNRPERRNAINTELWIKLHEQLSSVADDRDIRVLVLTGAGGAFCSGGDVSGGVPAGHPWYRMRWVNRVAMLIHDLAVPTIAKVAGPAIGAGWNLALSCDFVVSTPAAKFSQLFSPRGLSVDFGGSWILPKLVGLQQAKRLVLLGEMLDGVEAHRLGLVTWLAEPDEIDAFVDDLAGRLSAGPPVALAQSKVLLNEGASSTLREALANEARAQTVNNATADSHAAFRAFREHTEPTFTGEWLVK